MRIISRILSTLRGRGRTRTTGTRRTRGGLLSRIIAAIKAFFGGGRRATRTHRI